MHEEDTDDVTGVLSAAVLEESPIARIRRQHFSARRAKWDPRAHWTFHRWVMHIMGFRKVWEGNGTPHDGTIGDWSPKMLAGLSSRDIKIWQRETDKDPQHIEIWLKVNSSFITVAIEYGVIFLLAWALTWV